MITNKVTLYTDGPGGYTLVAEFQMSRSSLLQLISCSKQFRLMSGKIAYEIVQSCQVANSLCTIYFNKGMAFTYEN